MLGKGVVWNEITETFPGRVTGAIQHVAVQVNADSLELHWKNCKESYHAPAPIWHQWSWLSLLRLPRGTHLRWYSQDYQRVKRHQCQRVQFHPFIVIRRGHYRWKRATFCWRWPVVRELKQGHLLPTLLMDSRVSKWLKIYWIRCANSFAIQRCLFLSVGCLV